MLRRRIAVCLLASVMVAVGCGGSSTKKVSRVESDTTIDLSGKWNDTDSRLVADEMITDALSQRWITVWEERGEVPTVTIGRVTNRSHEHINVQTFTRNIERALLNSGKVNFVASGSERQQLRAEREDQQENTSFETRSEMGEEEGAALMMTGTINTIMDKEGGKSVIFYQVNMELIEIQSNRKVWIGEKQIKKFVQQSKAKL